MLKRLKTEEAQSACGRTGREGGAIGRGEGGTTGGQGEERYCTYFFHPLGESPTLSSDRGRDYWRRKGREGGTTRG